MRVFLDTNVLASAVATRGLCADVVREVFARHEVIVSKQVLDELRRVLHSKFNLPKILIADTIDLMREGSTLVKSGKLPEIELKDISDLRIIAAAIVGDAEVFLTGDAELLALRQCQGMEILSPRQFWENLAGGGNQT